MDVYWKEAAKKNAQSYNADILNPFRLRQTLSHGQLWKVLLMSFFLPVRVLLILIVLSLAWLISIITLVGLPPEQADGQLPISGWRRQWAKPLISRMCRFVFFLGGYVWVPQKGKRAPKSEAPILLLMPHSSFLDTALVTVLHCPGLVVKDYTANAPFFGDLIRYTQPLYVKSEDPEARRRISEEIRRRVHSDLDFEQLMLFPEGGCGNRKALLQFKLGAFTPGVPVQPVFIRYNNKLDSISWTWDGPGAWRQLCLSLTQFRIYCELEFLPVYKPTELERNDPRMFANNVRDFVSSWTNCPVTHFCVEDARFLPVAEKMDLPLTVPLVKFLRLRAAIGHQDMDPAEELQCLEERNKSMESYDGDAWKMAEYLGLETCPEALKDFFRSINPKSKDKLDVRIYLACLCSIRKDLKTRLKFKLAFQTFLSDTESEHLSTVLLLWKGIPVDISSKKLICDKITNGANEHDSRNFL